MRNIENIISKMFETDSGTIFFKLKDKLIKLVNDKSKEQITDALINYAQNGKLQHVRGLILTDILKLVGEGDMKYSDFFEVGLHDNQLAYWCVDGFIKIQGTEAYAELVNMALDTKNSLELRSKIVKSLSQHSNQCFDKGLPKDPGFWKESDIDIDKLKEWCQAGFPKGQGYNLPKRHFSLDNPSNQFEKTVSKLDKKLSKLRENQQDLSNPSNWLILSEQKVLEEIKNKWRLPKLYLDFITLYSPLNVHINSKKFISGLSILGAHNIIGGQSGYSFNPVSNIVIEEWPQELLVIAVDNGDPYCLDLSKSDGNDAPVLYAIHGTGEWKFELYAESFLEFLKMLSC